MSFSFKKKESVGRAVRRLGRKRIEKALECLVDCRQAETIHCVRKEIKKARAVLRLARGSLGKSVYRKLKKQLREAASHLSPARDAHVKRAALDKLARHFKKQLAPRRFGHLRAALQKDARAKMHQFVDRRASNVVARLLRPAVKDFDRLKLGVKGWEALRPGVKAAYRQGRQAFATVVDRPSPEAFHEWRKRVKELGYDVCLLQPAWPEQLEAVATELELLGDQLGDDHDLFLLRQAAEKPGASESPREEIETLRALIDQRQRELRAASVKLGARFYAEKPSRFIGRLGQYWRVWRREKSAALTQRG